ncbi:hypothetical protein CHGG_03407 [Chaetomium globosum CBS 148.51]|uniref:Cell wall mannoprotein PIR1-like C-terminal domain-containing protein n=1 Tax=Chaetomium globosum (strain ATCC 6205 / CBS 148.51 / DSM 1962 / NBRC 6347 / NRRL 1970) TaxID=306901 RepID=Q2H8P7_CHAGB|nr:uncharacterized protein CHGG_03407 [Chaetomium globosum CBS 148.51]EAQ91472.1 hypothetical protein CHGG_03407 [Chaetomium globosum CBS 148.51]
MKLLAVLAATAALAPHSALARWLSRANTPPGCAFTLSSSGSSVFPPTEQNEGFKLIAPSYHVGEELEPPTTQIQCDQGKSPVSGFSIDASNNLLYRGSPDFWACPATDTEYNIYVNPEFGQTKCFPITLKASGCGPEAPTCAPPSTVWETQTQTVTVIVTNSQTCSAEPTSTASTSLDTVCHHCTRSKSSTSSSDGGNFTILPISTETTPPISPSSSEIFTILPISTDAAHRKRSPSLEHVKKGPDVGVEPRSSHHRLSKRALYEDWNAVRQATGNGARDTPEMKWVRTGRVRVFPLVPGHRRPASASSLAPHSAIQPQPGCVEFEERDRARIPRCSRASQASLQTPAPRWRTCLRRPAPTNALPGSWAPSPMTVGTRGRPALKEWMVREGVPAGNLHYTEYRGGSGEVDGPPAGIFGKALVTVTPETDPDTQTQRSVLRVYMTSDLPRIVLTFDNQEGRLVLNPIMDVSRSPRTTDGNRRYDDAPTE